MPDYYPPLSVLVQWREQNVDPGEIFRRCQEYANYRPKSEYPKKICSICGGKYLAKGLCRKCYDRQRRGYDLQGN